MPIAQPEGGVELQLYTHLDSLVFGEQARGLDEDFRLRFEALKDFTPAERSVAGEVLDRLILQSLVCTSVVAGVSRVFVRLRFTNRTYAAEF